MADTTTPRRRANKRGLATRENMISAAIASLATGDPTAVSGNRIARDIGVTWGAIQYQFGDIDGLWAAVLRRTAELRGDLPANAKPGGTLRERVTALIDTTLVGLRTPESLAIETLRAALPRDLDELEREYPLTAAEFASWKPGWDAACARAFTDLDVDPARVRQMAALIPAAMRGLTSERMLGTYGNLDDARLGLIDAIVALLCTDSAATVDDGRGTLPL
ncbi:MAG: TetR/AcrR family transcriptional regulator [Gordonia sp. (in: high G+C Gram-positive bacteria)]|uniref:TetR/AcrR family transcriptional regulator n=1 Tax=Gordonia sp. (in: high G+C Gram-positive bacteria) TaxID=84139 RepID=UPI0039E711B9